MVMQCTPTLILGNQSWGLGMMQLMCACAGVTSSIATQKQKGARRDTKEVTRKMVAVGGRAGGCELRPAITGERYTGS